MQYIGKGCPILNTLILDDLPDFTDSMIVKFVAHCHTLRHISLMGGGSKITDKGFKYLAMENRKLRIIKIESKPLASMCTVLFVIKFALYSIQWKYLYGVVCVNVCTTVEPPKEDTRTVYYIPLYKGHCFRPQIYFLYKLYIEKPLKKEDNLSLQGTKLLNLYWSQSVLCSEVPLYILTSIGAPFM